MLSFRTFSLVVLAVAAATLSVPIRLRDFVPGVGNNGLMTPFDPVTEDDCGLGLDENALAIKVSPVLQVGNNSYSPLSSGSGGAVIFFNIGTQVLTGVQIVGECATCGEHDIEASPAVLSFFGAQNGAPVVGPIDILLGQDITDGDN